MVEVEAEVVPFEVGVFQDPLVVVVAQRGVELGLVISPAEGKVVFCSGCALENIIPVVVALYRVFVGDQGTWCVARFDKFYPLCSQLSIGQINGKQNTQTILSSFQAFIAFFAKTFANCGHRNFFAQLAGN